MSSFLTVWPKLEQQTSCKTSLAIWSLIKVVKKKAGGLHYFVSGPIFPLSFHPKYFSLQLFPLFSRRQHSPHSWSGYWSTGMLQILKIPIAYYTICSLSSYPESTAVNCYNIFCNNWLSLLSEICLPLPSWETGKVGITLIIICIWSSPCDPAHVIPEHRGSKTRN